MPKLTIIRGLPGSGKSTLAREMANKTGALLLEPDMTHVRDGKYKYAPKRHKCAINQALGVALSFGENFLCDIVICDVFPDLAQPDIYEFFDQMRKLNYHIRVIELIISVEESKRRNQHDVRHEDIDHMAREWRGYYGEEIWTRYTGNDLPCDNITCKYSYCMPDYHYLLHQRNDIALCPDYHNPSIIINEATNE